MATRWVAHIDMDAYYVSCELRDRPELVGRPVIVGHAPTGPGSRGVVLSASYEARAFGIRSAMPAVVAARRCPKAVWIPPDFGKYARVSHEILEHLGRFGHGVVPLSIDEAALEVEREDSAAIEAWAREVQRSIRDELRLPCSIGASPYAVVAKIASDVAKPGGVRVVPAGSTAEFLNGLPVGAIPGVGPKSSERLLAAGIRTIGELAGQPVEPLRRILGRFGDSIRELALGRPGPELAALPSRSSPKQRSLDRTFEHDTSTTEDIARHLNEMAKQLADGLAEEGLRYQSVVVRFRWSDFTQLQRGHQLPAALEGPEPLARESARLAEELLERERRGLGRAVRRISLAVGKLQTRRNRQLPLDQFSPAPASR
jgi:nucleotidyltransferase/DNA polymerase involved in DNA repair